LADSGDVVLGVAVRRTMDALNLSGGDSIWSSRLLQCNQILQVRHAAIIVGGAGSGKSTLIDVMSSIPLEYSWSQQFVQASGMRAS